MFKTFQYKRWDLRDLNNHCNIFYSEKLNQMMCVLLRSLHTLNEERIDNEYSIIARSIKVVYYTHIYIYIYI